MAEQTRFGAILKRYRVAAGLSQEALAARASLSVRAISDLERGLHRTPHPETLDLLATALALAPTQRAVLLAEIYPPTPTPLYTPEPQPRRLPVAPTALIGRDQERRRARALLLERLCRLLTLVGPGGAGKTRLALDIVTSLATEFADGVIFVDLAPVRSAHLLFTVIAQALGLRERAPGAPAESAVYTELREKRALLFLDNFEHMLAMTPAIADLLAHCPRLTILVTSRIRLGVRGEHLLPVAPLTLDAAVALFCERACAVRPDRNTPRELVAAICQRVDCLPLAIELAAVQTRLLPLSQLLDYLTHRLALLRGGASDLPSRQQTMEDTIAWSYELLGDAQQRCFRALGVFVGGWTLEAAQAVCWDADSSAATTATAATAATAATDTLLTLAALVDASLVQADEMADGSVRFRMLELIHDYALARLEESREARACHLGHARYFAQMGDAISHVGPGRLPNGADPSLELPNARAALEWVEQVGEAALGLRLAGFGRLWHLLGQPGEALLWQERMLALDERTPIREGDATRLVLRAERLYGLGRTLLGVGEYERAEAQARAALELALRLGDDGLTSNVYMTIGMIAHARGEYDMAVGALTAACERTPTFDQTGQRHRVESLLADTERRRGNLTTSAARLESAVADAEALDNAWDTARLTAMRGLVACQQAHYSEATHCFVKALALFRPFGSPRFSAWCLEGFAAVLSAQGAHTSVARLCGAAANLRTQAQAPAPTAEQEAIDAMLATARAHLGEQAFADIWREGCALTLGAAIEEAHAEGLRRLDAEAAERNVAPMTTTTYALYLESGPKRRKTMVHALDLLGCVAVGPTTDAALAATPTAIRAYLRFLARHGEPLAQGSPDAPFETRVVEHITEGAWLGNGSPYLIFGPDLEPLSDAEIEVCLIRCRWLCDELAEWASAQSEEQLAAQPEDGGRPARAILLHVLGAQGAYLGAALGSAPGFSALASAAERGDASLASALRQSASLVAERVHATTPAQRVAVRSLPAGPRTLHKALRRILEHSWEHLAELGRRPGGPDL